MKLPQVKRKTLVALLRLNSKPSRYSFLALCIAFALQIVPIERASAEDCAKHDLATIFDEEFFPEVKWDTSSKPRIINWSTNVQSVNNVSIARPFSPNELELLQLSFDAWDLALESINFQRVDDASKAEILVGLTPIQNNGFWTIEVSEKVRKKGTIQISSTTPIILTREGFIEIAQSEIGNLLGLGDIQHKIEQESVMFDPDLPPFGEEVLSDFDVELIRQFYGESTCRSQWPAALVRAKESWQTKKAVNQADAQARAQEKADMDAKAKAQAELEAQIKAKEEAEAKARAALEAQKRQKTIVCIKGSKTKRVTGVSPKCPKGYKRR